MVIELLLLSLVSSTVDGRFATTSVTVGFLFRRVMAISDNLIVFCFRRAERWLSLGQIIQIFYQPVLKGRTRKHQLWS